MMNIQANRRTVIKRDKPLILVVEDEIRYIRAIQVNLEISGYQVVLAQTGANAIDLIFTQEPDLVLLDLRLPDISGFEVCRQVCEFSNVPIIMLTALANEMDKVKGLDLGAIDYITKPFSAPELLARVRAALRCATDNQTLSESIFRSGNLSVDFAQKRVFYDGNEIKLTSIEYCLLREMIHNTGRVLVPGYLLIRVWGPEYEECTYLLWQAVHRLRQKLEPNPKHPIYIKTRPGIGYIFDPPVC